MKKTDILVKKSILDKLETIFDDLDAQERAVHITYGRTGNQVQSKKWNKETREYDYLFDDDGNPLMEDEWDDIPKTELSDRDKAELKAIEVIKSALEKLI